MMISLWLNVWLCVFIKCVLTINIDNLSVLNHIDCEYAFGLIIQYLLLVALCFFVIFATFSKNPFWIRKYSISSANHVQFVILGVSIVNICTCVIKSLNIYKRSLNPNYMKIKLIKIDWINAYRGIEDWTGEKRNWAMLCGDVDKGK